jgi:hypothetical protein
VQLNCLVLSRLPSISHVHGKCVRLGALLQLRHRGFCRAYPSTRTRARVGPSVHDILRTPHVHRDIAAWSKSTAHCRIDAHDVRARAHPMIFVSVHTVEFFRSSSARPPLGSLGCSEEVSAANVFSRLKHGPDATTASTVGRGDRYRRGHAVDERQSCQLSRARVHGRSTASRCNSGGRAKHEQAGIPAREHNGRRYLQGGSELLRLCTELLSSRLRLGAHEARRAHRASVRPCVPSPM